MAAFAGLFRATEQAFGHRRVWMKLQRMLERADVPLRTVEFVYIMARLRVRLRLPRGADGPLLDRDPDRARRRRRACRTCGSRFKAKRRMNAFENQLPDLLVTLAASLKAGHSFKQGIQTIVDEGQEPASKELGRVISDTRLGPPDGRGARRHGRADRLEELLVRDHRGDDPAPGRRQPRGPVRHGRRHRPPAAAVRPQDQGADRDGTRLGLRADRTAVLRRLRDHAPEPVVHGAALRHHNGPPA